MKKIFKLAAAFAAGVIIGMLIAQCPLVAQDAAQNQDVMAKLDEIAKSQQDLVTTINAIKEDIAIIRVRVTSMQ